MSGTSASDDRLLKMPERELVDMTHLPAIDELSETELQAIAKRLRQDVRVGTRVPVIFLTARDTTADKVEGLRLGVDDYVTKPFSIEELVERVKAAFERHRARRAEAHVSRSHPRRGDTRRLARRSPHRTDADGVPPAPLPAVEGP